MGKDEGSRRNFRPVRGFQDAVVSQQYFAAREPVSIACGAQIGIRHRHGSRAEVNSSAAPTDSDWPIRVPDSSFS